LDESCVNAGDQLLLQMPYFHSFFFFFLLFHFPLYYETSTQG